MTRQDTHYRNNSSQGYKNAVIEALQKERGMDEALKLFGRFYTPVKKVWGHEPNAEEFAKHILQLDRWAQYRPQAGQGISIRHINPVSRMSADGRYYHVNEHARKRIAITKKRSLPHLHHEILDEQLVTSERQHFIHERPH